MKKLHDEHFNTRFNIELLYGGKYEIDAEHLQDAVDYLIDYLNDLNMIAIDENKAEPYRGYFLTDEEVEEYGDANELDNYICGGNFCQYLNFQWHEIIISEVAK